jgi:hypothetical protein
MIFGASVLQRALLGSDRRDSDHNRVVYSTVQYCTWARLANPESCRDDITSLFGKSGEAIKGVLEIHNAADSFNIMVTYSFVRLFRERRKQGRKHCSVSGVVDPREMGPRYAREFGTRRLRNARSETAYNRVEGQWACARILEPKLKRAARQREYSTVLSVHKKSVIRVMP